MTIEQAISSKTKQQEQVKSEEQQEDVAIITTEYGDLIVEFFEGVAPKHVESFKLHAQNGFYNGTLFHRVIPGFMIQGGDPNTKEITKRAMVQAVMLQNILEWVMRVSPLPGTYPLSSMI